ncbi:MAG TPA: NAD-dependent epimerase/dehydratase family protein [Xanthobacteraceae bacterium]|jgi:nucleoside-diphosphate-sugar epimerase|nr:NAD-dependent epimerase/dehydratase family protein [Xanthobacteraceae bacterium]
MTTLVCLGFGYSARHYVALYGKRFERIVGTTRSAENAEVLHSRRLGGNVAEIIVFDGTVPSSDLAAAVADAAVVLVSIPPDRHIDPALAHFRGAIAAAPRLKSIVYLSTIAVYGDHDGRWIDETTPLAPARTRAASRIDAESAWQAFGEAHNVPVAVIRIAGIYGPGINALETVKGGQARRIVKPGQVFNRIHVADLAQVIDKAVDMALTPHAGGVFNAADDEPTAPGDPILFAAHLLGVAPPAEIAFEEAKKTMSPLAVSFYGESKRVRNDRIKSVLGVSLRYPTYREGLRALAIEMSDQN